MALLPHSRNLNRSNRNETDPSRGGSRPGSGWLRYDDAAGAGAVRAGVRRLFVALLDRRAAAQRRQAERSAGSRDQPGRCSDHADLLWPAADESDRGDAAGHDCHHDPGPPGRDPNHPPDERNHEMSAVDTTQVALQTALQAAEVVAPVALAAAAAVDPRAALALQLAPAAVQAVNSVMQLSQAGVMTPEQLQTLWQQIGEGVLKAHSDWAAMNAPTMPNSGGVSAAAAVAPAAPMPAMPPAMPTPAGAPPSQYEPRER